jgi:hypothetical protein
LDEEKNKEKILGIGNDVNLCTEKGITEERSPVRRNKSMGERRKWK